MSDDGLAPGKRLSEIRQQLGLSQRRAAELSGLTHSAISTIEQDKVSPAISTLQKLLKVRHRPLPPAAVFVHLSEYVPIGIPMFRYMNQSERRALHDPTTALHSKLIFPQKTLLSVP